MHVNSRNNTFFLHSIQRDVCIIKLIDVLFDLKFGQIGINGTNLGVFDLKKSDLSHWMQI